MNFITSRYYTNKSFTTYGEIKTYRHYMSKTHFTVILNLTNNSWIDLTLKYYISRKVGWEGESLANLANHQWFVKLKIIQISSYN